jgi:hypothetical protein
MLWMKGETETSGVEVLEDPAVEPALAVLDGNATDDGEAQEADNGGLWWPWADLTEAGPVVVLDARDPDEEGEEEEEEEEDADFFDDEEDEDEDLDDDLEDDDLEDEEFEDEEEEEEEEEEDDEF